MLDTDLRHAANLDLGALFESLSGKMAGADFGDIHFDASSILTIVERAAPPDIGRVLVLASTASSVLQSRTGPALPGADLPGSVGQAQNLLAKLASPAALLQPDIGSDAATGLDALLSHGDAVVSAVQSGPLAALLGLVPEFPAAAIGDIGGLLAGAIEALKVLVALGATSAVSTRLLGQAELLAGRLDPAAATAAAARVSRAAVPALPAALAAADPNDGGAVDSLGAQVVTFLDAAAEMQRSWSVGMGFGEAALLGLDIAGGAAALEAARLALTSADLGRVTAMSTAIRGYADPLLQLPLPVPADVARDVIDQALDLVDGLATSVESWDVTAVTTPITRFADLALEPLDEVRQAIEEIAGRITSAIHTLRDLVDQVDLQGVADAIRQALSPVVDTIEAVSQAIDVAQQAITGACTAIENTLSAISSDVRTAAQDVKDALGRVRQALEQVHVADIAAAVRTEIGKVVDALASAQLKPYFDTAIEVIDTGTQVINAVPFSMLPTDVQQDVVDVAKPIKELDLQDVEDTLRGELATIRESLHTDALDAIGEASQAVVDFLASLDPEPPLQELERGPLQDLKQAIDGVDPQALLAPAEEGLQSLRGQLGQINLRDEVLGPLNGLFTPVTGALNDINPGALLAPVEESLASVRTSITDVLALDAIQDQVTSFRTGAQAALARLDPAALVAVLDDEVSARIAGLPAGPPGGAFGSLLVTLGQASGLDITEPSIADVFAWVGGHADGAAAVRQRLQQTADRVAGVHTAVTGLDPAPVTAAAQGYHRSLVAALANHPADSKLRLALDPLLAATAPTDMLGPLAENHRRYLAALEAGASAARDLAASARSEVTVAASGLSVSLVPLAAFPAKARELLTGLGLHGDAPLRDLVAELYRIAGPARLLPALTHLVQAGVAKLIALLDAATEPALGAIGRVRGVIDALDVQPVIDELNGLHDQVVGEIEALSPEKLLGGVLDEVDATLAQLAHFDPLAPVKDAIDAAKKAAGSILETARPTVVFADVVTMHHDIVTLAAGLDVKALVEPVLTSLDGLGGQLDDGFGRTGSALQRLQAALPDHVSSSGGPVSGQASGSIG